MQRKVEHGVGVKGGRELSVSFRGIPGLDHWEQTPQCQGLDDGSKLHTAMGIDDVERQQDSNGGGGSAKLVISRCDHVTCPTSHVIKVG